MSSNQMPSADSDPPKFHRLFKFYDPEVVAVSGCGTNNLSLRKTDNGSLGSCCNNFLSDVLLNVVLIWIFTLTICFPPLAYDNIIRFVPAPPDYTSLQRQHWYKIFLYMPPLCWFCVCDCWIIWYGIWKNSKERTVKKLSDLWSCWPGGDTDWTYSLWLCCKYLSGPPSLLTWNP